MSAAIEFRNICKSYGDKTVLDNFNLSVEKGEVDLSGNIDSIAYSSAAPTGKQAENFLSKLFK